jgi:hypothetical protein
MPNPPTKTLRTFGRIAGEETANEQISRRAYERYEARGRGDGHDLEDWHEAEAELSGRGEKAAA